MYNQNLKNQAVKECINGSSQVATARKFGISHSALRVWIKEYKDYMESAAMPLVQPVNTSKESLEKYTDINLTAVNVSINGTEITISRSDAERIMGLFSQFEE